MLGVWWQLLWTGGSRGWSHQPLAQMTLQSHASARSKAVRAPLRLRPRVLIIRQIGHVLGGRPASKNLYGAGVLGVMGRKA
eukprot:362011-Chlamydomonas_euryale.AAC.2